MKTIILSFILFLPFTVHGDDVALTDSTDVTVRKTIPLMTNGMGNKGGDIGAFVSNVQGLECDPKICLVAPEEIKH